MPQTLPGTPLQPHATQPKPEAACPPPTHPHPPLTPPTHQLVVAQSVVRAQVTVSGSLPAPPGVPVLLLILQP